MLKILSLLACTAVISTGCAANPNNPETTFPVTATLQAGQSQSIGGLNVTFVGVTTDSRCPIDATCISAGDATMQFVLTANRHASVPTLAVDHPTNKRTTYEGYSIEVQSLAPFPAASRPIKPEDYKVTFVVNR